MEKQIFKFKRYKIPHNGKTYYVMVPEEINENVWIVDWADDWYDTFVTGSLFAMKVLAASFTILGFNPYVIIYLPVGNDRIPNTLAYNDNGMYDIVFKTNRTHLKDKEWKAIRGKLKKATWTRYKLKVDEERIDRYFSKKAGYLTKVPEKKILKKAGADTWLAVGTAFFCFPRDYYGLQAPSKWQWIRDVLSVDDRRCNYNEERDHFTADMDSFCWCEYRRKKFTYERPGCSWYTEMYDMDIANKHKKNKVYMIENVKKRIEKH